MSRGVSAQTGLLDAVDNHRSAREKRIVRPRAVIRGEIVERINVEKSNLAQQPLNDLARVEHSQATPVVRLVDEISADVEVVIDRRGRAIVVSRKDRGIEIGYVPDPGSRGCLNVLSSPSSLTRKKR